MKDACLAYAKSCELQKTVDHDSPYSEVEFWLDQNKAFEEYMTQVSHEIEQHEEGPYAKYKSFATPAVRKMLAEKGLTITFPEKVLIKVWKMRRVEDAMYQKIEEAKKQNSSNVPLDEASLTLNWWIPSKEIPKTPRQKPNPKRNPHCRSPSTV